MGIDSRFSKHALLEEYQRDPKSKVLLQSLSEEVQMSLHEVIAPKMKEIVNQLRSLGHDLKDYEPPLPGSLTLRDDSAEEGEYRCDLRLAVDTIISTGFRDTVDYEKESLQGLDLD